MCLIQLQANTRFLFSSETFGDENKFDLQSLDFKVGNEHSNDRLSFEDLWSFIASSLGDYHWCGWESINFYYNKIRLSLSGRNVKLHLSFLFQRIGNWIVRPRKSLKGNRLVLTSRWNWIISLVLLKSHSSRQKSLLLSNSSASATRHRLLTIAALFAGLNRRQFSWRDNSVFLNNLLGLKTYWHC